MSSIKIKDDAGNWVFVSGTAAAPEIWQSISGTSTFDANANGGNYSVVTDNDQGYVFCRLPIAPIDGTIVRVQVIGGANWLYLQARGSDTIDFEANQILARHNQEMVESVRYYQGHWFRLEGSYTYTPPPLIGPYLLTSLSTNSQEVIVSISPVLSSASVEINPTITKLEILSNP
jgi:hypothetical protein